MNELDLFVAANAIPDPAERAAYLDRACADQPELRLRLEALLAGNAQSRHPLDQPPNHLSADATSSFGDPAATSSLRAVPSVDEAEGTVVAERYKLRQQIGEGGMGSVWMADQTEPVKRKVAVKLIRVERGQSKTILARFEAERQAIALMDHPHIAKLLDAGTTETGAPFFVMELVKGVPLNDYCDEHKLTIHERLNLFTQICSAVQHAHQKGIIHRDLKPSNILVESHDGKPVPKVIDFGLAKATTGMQLTDQSMFTAFGSVMGTPLYMAPEQATFNAVDVDTRADVYALGVILYELLTGTTPLTKESMKKAALDEMLKLIREQEAPTPSSRLSSSDNAPSVAASRQMEPLKLGRFVKGELDWIVLKALSKDRDRRYETANGFARDVERFLSHEPVTAGPPSASYRFQKFVQRNRGQVIATSLVLVALLAGVVGTTVGLVEAKKQEAEATKQTAIAQANESLANTRLQEVETEKRKVEAEKQRADEEKQIAQAVNDFLHNKLLAQASTTVQADALMRAGQLSAEAKQNPTIRELLDRAAKELALDKIEANFPNQPLVQAQILRTVGEAYRGIGEAARGIPFLTRSLDLYKAKLGSDHSITHNSMGNLALGYWDVGKLDKALPLFEETLKLTEAKLGAGHPDTLQSMNNLAMGYQTAGKLDKAISLLEQTFKLAKAKLGPEHPNTLQSMNNLAAGYQTAGKLDKALPLFEESLKLHKAMLGPEHPDTLSSMNNIAAGYRAAGQLDKAILFYEETLKLTKAKLGPEHPDTLLSMNNLAVSYSAAGQRIKALPMYEETLELMKAKLGPDHPSTLTSMNNLAAEYQEAGERNKALPLYEETLKLMKVKLGPDHPTTLIIRNNLAVNYSLTGQRDKALPLFEETLKLMKAKLGPDHPSTLNSLGNLGKACCDAKQGDKAAPLLKEFIAGSRKNHSKESPQFAGLLAQMSVRLLECDQFTPAEEMLRECLAIREKKEPDVWTTFNTQSLLGGALLGQKKYADAEPLLLKGYEGMKAREKAIPEQGEIRIPEALDRLIKLYTATNKPDEVKKYQELRAKYPTPKESKK